jgi:hypothetical protein
MKKNCNFVGIKFIELNTKNVSNQLKILVTRKPENHLLFFFKTIKKQKKKRDSPVGKVLAKNPLRKIENLATGKPQNHLLLAPF